MSKTRCCIAVVCNLNREFHDQTFPVSPYSYWCWHIVTSLKLCSSAPCQCGSRQQRWITGFSLMDFHQRWLLLCNLHSCWLVFHTLHFFTHTQVIPFTSSFSLCFLHQLEEQTRPHFFFFFLPWTRSSSLSIISHTLSLAMATKGLLQWLQNCTGLRREAELLYMKRQVGQSYLGLSLACK